jgi:hypothetical protein
MPKQTDAPRVSTWLEERTVLLSEKEEKSERAKSDWGQW